ncbi:MAG TPA: tetratricopeptide repeat protein [Gemmatimonadales bacterium]|nr:tetratricopeptide repeat protein [Gemmatimonadales bacterium]
MDAEVYPDERVARFIQENFLPARVHVKDQAAEFRRLGERYNAQWTPTLLVLDPEGTERHRIEGFLPAEDVLAQLTLGLGHSAFARQQWDEAERRFREVVERYPNTEAAPEALYWAGVARYKGKGDAKALGETAQEFSRRYKDTSWAKKASVWAA